MSRYLPKQAIRDKCYDCSCGNKAEIAKCPVKQCALWGFRFGRYPEKNLKYQKLEKNKINSYIGEWKSS